MTDPIKVAIIDDQALVRAGLAMVIDSQPDLQVVAQGASGSEAIHLAATIDIDILLMDVRMPGMDGIVATEHILGVSDDAPPPASPPRIVILTTFDVDEYALAAIRAGASGFLLKDTPPEEMLKAVRTVHAGDAVIAPSTTRRLLEHLVSGPALASSDASRSSDTAQATPVIDPRIEQLTEREREVLVLVAQGLSNSEIATQLIVAEPTVKTHVGRVLMKLGVRDRVQAVVLAYELGLVGRGQ